MPSYFVHYWRGKGELLRTIQFILMNSHIPVQMLGMFLVKALFSVYASWHFPIDYSQVYRGVLDNGWQVAIKRARGSRQGGREFKTEIELLSRVHHKNLISLLGFSMEQGEQMLVYEFMVNGSLKESLSGMLITLVPNF